MERLIGMDQLRDGGIGTVQAVELEGNIRRRMQDLGLICGTKVQCVHRSPHGDPVAYLIRGAVIALRCSDAKHILIRLE